MAHRYHTLKQLLDHPEFSEGQYWCRARYQAGELVIREGEPVAEILALIQEDQRIGVLVLGAGTDKSGPGPLVTQMSRNSGSLPIPITIVPGEMSKERLEEIT